MSRSEVSKNSFPGTPPVPASEQPGTGPVDAASNAGCTDCDRTRLIAVNLPGVGDTYLDESFAARVQEFIGNAATNGVNIHFNSAYRSPARQAALRNDPTAITPATTSLHSCGFAVDVSYDSLPNNEQRRILREAAESAGLSWGGNFRIPDRPHFYANPPIDRARAIECATRQHNELNN